MITAMRDFFGKFWPTQKQLVGLSAPMQVQQKGIEVRGANGQLVNPQHFFFRIGGVLPDANWGGFQADVLAFGANPDIFKVVNKIASSVARVPVNVTRRRSNVAFSNGDFLAMLENPNEYQAREEFVQQANSYLLTTGNCFLAKNTFEGRVIGFKLLHVPDVTILTSSREDGPIYGYTFDGKIYQPSDILHLRYCPDIAKRTHWGASPLRSGAKLVSASNAALTASSALRENLGAHGIISSKDASVPMLPKERDKMQEELDRQIGGPEKSGRVTFSTSAIEYTSIAFNAKDLDLDSARRWSVKDICNLYGVPAAIMGEGEGLTYNGMPEAYAEFYQNLVAPLAQRFWKEVGMFMADSLFLEAKIDPDFSKIEAMQMKPEKKTAILADVQAGILTRREARMILYPHLDPDAIDQLNTQTDPQP